MFFGHFRGEEQRDSVVNLIVKTIVNDSKTLTQADKGEAGNNKSRKPTGMLDQTDRINKSWMQNTQSEA